MAPAVGKAATVPGSARCRCIGSDAVRGGPLPCVDPERRATRVLARSRVARSTRRPERSACPPPPGGDELRARVWQILGIGTSLRISRSVSHVLRDDPDLGEAVPVQERDRAVEACIAHVARISRGEWSGQQTQLLRRRGRPARPRGIADPPGGVDGRFGAELLGEGDVLRPWQGEDAHPTLRIRPLAGDRSRARGGVGRARARRFARYPQLTGRLVGRALERSRNLAVSMAIHQQARVDVRLTMLFWHLADRWGRVRHDGILVPLRLTHTVLADLVAARRPTVSAAISRLARAGEVVRTDDGVLLTGEPPSELLELQEVRRRRPEADDTGRVNGCDGDSS